MSLERIGRCGGGAIAPSRHTRAIHWIPLILTLVYAFGALLETMHRPAIADSGMIEICSADGIRFIPAASAQGGEAIAANDDVMVATAAGPAPQDRSKAGRKGHCPSCPVSADLDSLPPVDMDFKAATPAPAPFVGAAEEALPPVRYWLSAQSRAPPLSPREDA
jgi:hypothetical protein